MLIRSSGPSNKADEDEGDRCLQALIIICAALVSGAILRFAGADITAAGEAVIA